MFEILESVLGVVKDKQFTHQTSLQDPNEEASVSFLRVLLQ